MTVELGDASLPLGGVRLPKVWLDLATSWATFEVLPAAAGPFQNIAFLRFILTLFWGWRRKSSRSSQIRSPAKKVRLDQPKIEASL